MKILIITSILLILLPIYSLTNWSQLSFRYFTTDAEQDIEIFTGASPTAESVSAESKFGLLYEHELSGKFSKSISYNISDDFFFSEKSHERRNSFLTNYLSLGLLYKKRSTYLQVKFNNRYNDPGETNYLFFPGIENNSQPQMVNSAAIHFKQNLGNFDVNIYSNLRDLKYKYVVPEEDEFSRDDQDEEEYNYYDGYDNDVYTQAEISYSAFPKLKIFANAYTKDDLNESKLYDHKRFGGGLEYNNNIDLFSSIKAKIQYYNNISDIINNQQDHDLVTHFRYTRRFRNGVSGFISYINRSCYDNETSKVYRVSNMLRVHAIYSYYLQNLKNSYILTGFKYNPENKGSLGFIEQNQYLLKNIYSTISVKYSLDFFTSYILKLEYFFSPLQSIWIRDEFTDYYNIQKQNLIFIGSTLIF